MSTFKEFTAKIKSKAKAIKADISAVFLAFKCKDTPVIAKIVAGVTVAYALSPIDLIPDFIPILGYLDDIIILPLLITLSVKLIPEEIFSRCKAAAADMWRDGKPKKWYFAIPIVIFWLVIVAIVLKAIFW